MPRPLYYQNTHHLAVIKEKYYQDIREHLVQCTIAIYIFTYITMDNILQRGCAIYPEARSAEGYIAQP